jgi:hypothetical protein
VPAISRLLACCFLFSACSSDGSSPKNSSDDDDNGDDTSSDSTDADDSSGKMSDSGTKGRMDASIIKETPASDGGNNSKPDASKADAGKVDAGKVDASVTPPSALKPKCMKKQSQGIVIGDSYINWITHQFPAQWDEVSGGGWRMEAIGAYSMGSGGIGFIPDQYKASIEKDPDAHTVLMDGGGNDILVADSNLDFWGDCKTDKAPTLPNCQTIVDKAIAAADKMLQQASADGIRDVVYFFYPHVPKGTLLGGPNPWAILDYAKPKVRDFCEGVEAKTNGKTRCSFLDTIPLFEGHDDWFVPGDIHETEKGSKAIVDAVWKIMKDKCIGQPASSGCCEP